MNEYVRNMAIIFLQCNNYESIKEYDMVGLILIQYSQGLLYNKLRLVMLTLTLTYQKKTNELSCLIANHK